jgi:septal ring factor EnvC (AmiA/AmiB activator)
LLGAALLAAAAQGAAASREEDLAALRARIESLRGELEGRESDRREARDALRASEVAISAAGRALQAREAGARAARAALADIGARRAEQERALEARQESLGRLLAARALAGQSGGAPDFVRIALSGEDFADASRRLHYLGFVSREAARAIEAHRAGLAELARLKGESEAKAGELATLEAESRADRERLLAERRERRRVLERIAGEIRSAKKRIQVLVADENRLARLVEEIAKLLAARPGAGYRREAVAAGSVADAAAGQAAGPFAALKGRLRLPVRGELAGRYGGQRMAGAAPAKGVFIRAAEGEAVRAVAPGRVVYADWMRGFGNLLIVDHGDAFLSIYGYNESLLKQAGDAVAFGEPLATVGQSGGNEETGLYFELRHLGKPFDPLSWVKLK